MLNPAGAVATETACALDDSLKQSHGPLWPCELRRRTERRSRTYASFPALCRSAFVGSQTL